MNPVIRLIQLNLNHKEKKQKFSIFIHSFVIKAEEEKKTDFFLLDYVEK
jgi:hypothetical protein